MSNLFLRLLNISITAGWIVLVVVLLRFVLKKAPKWVRVALWGLVAIRLLVPVSIESALSLVPSAETVSVEPMIYTVRENTDTVSYPVQGERVLIQSGVSALNSAVNPIIEPKTTQTLRAVTVLKAAAGWVWLAGVFGMFLYVLLSYLRIKRHVRASVKVETGVYVCDDISDPFILGLSRPKVFLPSGMDETTKGYVLAHEKAHLKRFDHIWKPLGFLLLAVYWFNPLLWLAYVLLCRDIELACDEKVARTLDDDGRAAYSSALLHCSVSRRSIAACPLAFGEVGVKQRVKSILSYKKPAFWIILAAILLGIVTAVCFLTVPKKNKVKDLASEGTVTVWFDDRVHIIYPDGPAPVKISSFPNVTFRWEDDGWGGTIIAEENGTTRTLFQGMPIENVYFEDVTGDQKPDLCASVCFGSGIVDEHIVVYDYANKQSYTLWNRGTFDYHLYTADGKLLVGKMPYMGDKQIDFGTLVMQDGLLCCRWQSDGSSSPLIRVLHESDLYGEWLVRDETDPDENVILYSYNLELWKEFTFREDGTVIYNETVPVSSNFELAFGHPVSYPYTVHDGMVFIGDPSGDGEQWHGTYDRKADTLCLKRRIALNRYIDVTLTRMGGSVDAKPAPVLDEDVLRAVWTLVEIEAPDGSNADPHALGIEQQLSFRSDGTVYVFKHDANSDMQYILPYALDGSRVSFDETELTYEPQTGMLRCDASGDGFSALWFARQANVSLPLPEEPKDLDSDTLCTVWTLAEIEAPDGSDGDANAFGIKVYLDFRDDGTVCIVDRSKENAASVLPYTFADNTVTVGETVFNYHPADRTLTCSDFLFDDADTLLFTRTPFESLASLRERVPEFFDLPSENGLTVYVFPQSAAYETYGLLAGIDLNDIRDMTYLCKLTLDEMKLVLSSYDISPDQIEIRVCSNDLSSYRAVVDDAYVEQLRSKLFDS